MKVHALALLLGGLASGFTLGDAHRTQDRTNASSPREALGLTRAQALEQFGVPEKVVRGQHHMKFVYPARGSGKTMLLFHGGIAVGQYGDSFRESVAVPDAGPYLGQSVDELVRRMGSTPRYSEGKLTFVLTYPGFEVSVADGVVVHVSSR